MARGTVKWFNASKGFGFIVAEESDESSNKDYFVHHSEIKVDGYATLRDGQKVEFEIGESEKGPCANNVVPI